MKYASPYYRRLLAIQDAGVRGLKKKLTQALLGKGQESEIQWDEFRDMLSRVLLIADLAGRASAYVSAGIPGKKEPIKNSHIKALYADDPMFKIMPFVRAVNFMLTRASIPFHEVEALSRAAKNRAFWVAGVTKMETLDLLKNKLAMIPAGQMESTAEFVKFAREAAQSISDSHAETILRTNVSRAFNQAHVSETANKMGKYVALLRLDEVHDNRTRGNPNGLYPSPRHPHWQMDGYIASPHDPVWSVITPPNGYNCRASTTPITWETAQKKGWATSDGKRKMDAIRRHNGGRQKLLDSKIYPDAGFQ